MVSTAVLDLRRYLGDTQFTFALRLNVTPVCVARWETSRPPTGKYIARLEHLAAQKGHDSSVHIFRQLLDLEILRQRFYQP